MRQPHDWQPTKAFYLEFLYEIYDLNDPNKNLSESKKLGYILNKLAKQATPQKPKKYDSPTRKPKFWSAEIIDDIKFLMSLQFNIDQNPQNTHSKTFSSNSSLVSDCDETYEYQIIVTPLKFKTNQKIEIEKDFEILGNLLSIEEVNLYESEKRGIMKRANHFLLTYDAADVSQNLEIFAQKGQMTKTIDGVGFFWLFQRQNLAFARFFEALSLRLQPLKTTPFFHRKIWRNFHL